MQVGGTGLPGSLYYPVTGRQAIAAARADFPNTWRGGRFEIDPQWAPAPPRLARREQVIAADITKDAHWQAILNSCQTRAESRLGDTNLFIQQSCTGNLRALLAGAAWAQLRSIFRSSTKLRD